MVYCGKPSRGCANCRQRKIRCDQTKPSCVQCQRAQFTCPGYRDFAALRFRDQSKDVVRKAKLASGETSRLSHNGLFKWRAEPSRMNHKVQDDGYVDSRGIGTSTGHESEKAVFKIPRPISISARDESICVFLRNYVFDDNSTAPRVYLTSSQLVQHATSSRAVWYAMSSIGLAVLSNRRNAPGLMAQARIEYGAALRLTNIALRERSTSLENTTLSAVMLLGMFEVMSCCAPRSVDNWQMHIDGAVTLLRLWDNHGIQNLTGMQLFSQVRADLMANCLRTQTHVPEAVRKLSTIARIYRTQESTQVEDLVNLVSQVTDLLADLRIDGIPEPLKVIDRTRDIDQKLHNWSRNLTSRWYYQVCHVSRQGSEDDATYKGCFHKYPDIWACNIWSYYRVARILINLLLRDQLLFNQLFEQQPYWTELLNEAKVNLSQLSVDIVLSVPYAISFFQRPLSLSPAGNNGSSTAEELKNGTHSGGCLGGYFILWPLYVAASVQSSSTQPRDWAISRLDYIGHRMGIGQALLMARVLRGEVAHEALAVFNYCHSYRP